MIGNIFGTTLKDILSNVVALVLAVFGAIQVYMGTIGEGDINWFNLTLAVGGAILGFLTGKTSNLKGSLK